MASTDLLQVKEEAREADAAWQAAAALSDIAEALAEGEHEAEAHSLDEEGKKDGDAAMPSASDAMEIEQPETSKESEAEPLREDDVAVRAARALGKLGASLGAKLPQSRLPKEAVTSTAPADFGGAIEAMEAAILAAEAPPPKAATPETETPPAPKTKTTATKAAAKTRVQSKASVKDLRAKLDQCRDESKDSKPTGGTGTPTPAASAAPSPGTEMSAVTTTTTEGTATVSMAKSPGISVGTASELRAKLMEAKQRVLGTNGASPVASLPPPPEKKKKDKKDKEKNEEKDDDKEKKKKKDKKEKKKEKDRQVMPKQQALPLLCDEKETKESKEAEKKAAIEQAKARRLEELRDRERENKAQQVHSKAAARKKKEVEDSVRDLARKLSQDILEISEIINVENIKEEAVKREGRGHFGVPGAMSNVKSEVKQEAGLAGLSGFSGPSIADFVKSENVKAEMGLPPGLGPEQRQMIISPEMYAQQMSQLQSMATPEAMALSASSSAVPNIDGRLEAEDLTKPSVCTIGWEPNVEPHVMIKLLEGYRIGSIIDARPPEFNTDGFCHACAAHGWTYDRQPVLSIHAYDLGQMGPVAFNTIGRIVSQARAQAAAGNDGSCRRQCILFAGDQSWQDECNWHIVNRLRGCAIEVQQISLDRYWDEAAVFEEEGEKGGVIVAGPPLTQVVDELRNQVGLPKIGDERDRQLMVTARAGLETWVAKKFKNDLRLQSKVLGPEATLKDKIDVLREACPELSRVVSMAHFLRMIGNNSAHTGGAAIPPRYQLVQLVQKLTHEIKESDAVTKAHDEADKKWETAEPFAAVLAKISGEPQSNPRAPVSARLQLQQSVIVPHDGEHKATLVYLHPFGSGNMRYLQGKSAFSAKGIRIVLPLAPTMPITAYNKRQCISWFDYYGSDRDLEADPLSLEDVRVRLSLTLEREATLLGENGQKRLLIGGLAQGGEAALHAALMHHQVLGGFVGVCTNLLPCTLPEGGGRMKLHFFGYDKDTKKWAAQTRDPLLPHHDLVEHGDVFGTGGSFNLARIDFKLEAQCLHLACDALLEPEEEETENAAPVDATDADAADVPEEAEAEGQEEEVEAEETNEVETNDDAMDPLLNEMAAAIGIDPEAVPLLEELSDGEGGEGGGEEIPGEALEAEGEADAPMDSDETRKREAEDSEVTLMRATAKVMPGKRARTSYEQGDDGQGDQDVEDPGDTKPSEDPVEKVPGSLTAVPEVQPETAVAEPEVQVEEAVEQPEAEKPCEAEAERDQSETTN